METQSHDNSFFGGSSAISCYSQVYPSHHFPVAGQGDGNPLVSTTLPHWIYCQQTPQNYIDSMTETGASEVRREISYFNYSIASGDVPIEASIDNAGRKEVNCLEPSNEIAHLTNLTGLEHLIPSENSNQGYSLATPGFPPKIPKSKARKKSDVGRSQREKIAEGLEAMREFLPHLKELSKESAMNDIIDHIKYLKTQLKDLSQSRLGGEPSSTPLIFHQGYGHYLLRDELLNNPLEEMIGKLMEVNPFAATQLLESKGLYMMPADLAEGLPPHI